VESTFNSVLYMSHVISSITITQHCWLCGLPCKENVINLKIGL